MDQGQTRADCVMARSYSEWHLWQGVGQIIPVPMAGLLTRHGDEPAKSHTSGGRYKAQKMWAKVSEARSFCVFPVLNQACNQDSQVLTQACNQDSQGSRADHIFFSRIYGSLPLRLAICKKDSNMRQHLLCGAGSVTRGPGGSVMSVPS
eukprot:354472-Chlamydomonas_euryale.AAC.2